MSLPLRHSLENVSSLDRALEDLLVRFIINIPSEDLSSVERELFHFEEASWFYTDFVRLMNPTLPCLKIKSFANHIIHLCPLVWKWDIKADQALHIFSLYKKTIPVRGAAIFNEKMNKILLVKGTESDSWSFPRGKISKDEDDVSCCIREVKEETGFDLTPYIEEDQFIEKNIQGKNYKIFLVANIPDTFEFKPQVRNEIEKIEWRDFRKITKSVYKSNSGTKYYLINSMLRPLSLWIKRQRQIKGEDKLKAYAEEQLKLLLGLTKSEEKTSDPGRELLNMLHSAVQSKSNKNQNTSKHSNDSEDSEEEYPSTTNQSTFDFTLNQGNLPQVSMNGSQPTNQLPFMFGLQPFAPFPFVNNAGVTNFPFVTNSPAPQATQSQGLTQYNSMNIGNLNTYNDMQPIPIHLSTPNVASLSRPTLVPATSQINNMNNINNIQDSSTESSIKPNSELLDLLKKPQIPASEDNNVKREVKILKRGEQLDQESDTNPDKKSPDNSYSLLNQLMNTKTNSEKHTMELNLNNITESRNLLNMLHKPHTNPPPNTNQPTFVPTKPHNLLTKESNSISNSSLFTGGSLEKAILSKNDHSNGMEYEDFEESSASEDEEEYIERELEELEIEEPPSFGTVDREALNTNYFDSNEIPHMDVSNISMNSTYEYSRNPTTLPVSPSSRKFMSPAFNANNHPTDKVDDTPKSKPKFKILKRGEKLDSPNLKTEQPVSVNNDPSDSDLKYISNVSLNPSSSLLNLLKKPSENENTAQASTDGLSQQTSNLLYQTSDYLTQSESTNFSKPTELLNILNKSKYKF
ncbi:hypothetical protein TBLA_0C05550 [Henningerozyma blattae CBS 6284]|uniref:Nudix hydrolase domain-containing protein n=1 Tax=Henningerozyma blattae (strain ATCC 34711 / CBS 6284 / DSM 70876 / NBRC 10599 / NRRL Y-10934 / UCD 77-7) TaxID=1071380 RepID=I2H1V1_HENB6|nr:hypothetical protein TBLA_0C05550 [Tetrapisispora blattae CBS 6284]CCH60353.1 hypothetical protein TBLA_0C05550 [Tetrapisispora blattae CBS 6284]